MRRFLLRVLSIVVVLLSTNSHVLAQTADDLVFANIFYYSSQDTAKPYATFEAAAKRSLELYKINYPNWKIVTDIYPDPFNFYYNGIPDHFNVDISEFGTIYTRKSMVQTSYECPRGWDYVETLVDEPRPKHKTVMCKPPPPCGCKEDGVGKPISPATGAEQLAEVDYTGGFLSSLTRNRSYRSDTGTWVDSNFISGVNLSQGASVLNTNSSYDGCQFGIGRSTNFAACLRYAASGLANDFRIRRGNAAAISFGNANNLNPSNIVNDRLSKVLNAEGGTVGWTVVRGSDEAREAFDTTGRIQTQVNRSGAMTTYTYSDATTPLAIAPKPGMLIRVTDHFGRQLNYEYDAAGNIVKMIDPAGGLYLYAYDEASSIVTASTRKANNLTSVTYPDGKKKIYWYNEQDKTSGFNLPHALTGITDENGARYATIKYDSAGTAISTELAGAVQKYVLSYPTQYSSANITDPLGTKLYYGYTKVLNRTLQNYWQKTPLGGTTIAMSISYDANGNVSRSSDYRGIPTTYVYDLSRNLETKRVEGDGYAVARTTSTVWHPTFRVPVQIHEPLRRTIFTHDANGNVLTKTEQATTDINGSQGAAATVVGAPRVWTYTYNSVGQVLTATGPRTDVNDITIYAYDNQGNLISVTNPAGHVTTMSNYDAHGHVGTITDPNGVVTHLTYHVRGWLLSRAVTADGITETTSYSYDGVGQMTKVTLPDNSTVNYTYDDAHRLTRISDHLGNSINYSLDNMGNRIKEEVKDTTGALTRQVTRVYDALNRLKEVTGGAQ